MQNKQIAKLHSSISTLHSQTLSFTTTKETLCEASESILYPIAYTLHDDARITPEGLQKDSRRTPEGLQKDETTTQKPSVECACALHCIATLNST